MAPFFLVGRQTPAPFDASADMHPSILPAPITVSRSAPQITLVWRIGTWLSCIAAWLLADAYLGVRHDGLLYLGQTLNRLDPSFYRHDLFLSLSGQDRFTIATALIGALYQLVDIGTGQMLILACTQIALGTIVWYWLRPLGWVAAACGLMAMAVSTHAYGPSYVFHAGERFVTARSFAEPVVLAGMLAVLHGRSRWGVGLLLLASALHPLMTAPAWAWWWLLSLPKDRRLWVLPAVALAALTLGALGAPGLAPLGLRFDPAWWEVVERRNFVLVGSYGLEGLMDVGAVGLLLVASRWAAAPLADGLRALATVTVLLVGATAWLADLAHLILPTQLQLLRATWLVQVLAIALLPWMLWTAWKKGSHGQIWALAVAAAATAGNAQIPTLWLYVLSALLASGLLYFEPAMRRRMTVALWSLAALLLLVACIGSWSQFHFSGQLYSPFAKHLTVLAFAATPPLSVALVALLHHDRLASLTKRTRGAWLPFLALGATAYGLANWDQRTPFVRAAESATPYANHPWQALIPIGEPVYWLNGDPAVWVLLKRPIYISTPQGAASLFNRNLALEYDLKMAPFRPLIEVATHCRLTYSLMGLLDFPGCAPSGKALEALCGRLPGFRFFVTSNEPSPRTSVATWRPPGKGLAHNDYALHDCAKLVPLFSAP